MKKSIVISILFYFVFLNPISTLASNSPSDTLIVRLGGNNQVRIVCASFDDLYKYSRADSLVSVFTTDIKKSFQDKDYGEWPQVLHYLVKGDGKRRLKIQSNEFTEEEFNLENEKYRLEENIPPFHYIIYDLSKSVELHIYMESADKINLFQQVSLDSAIHKLTQNKKTCNRNYKIEIVHENDSFRLGKFKGNKMYSINYSSDVNVYLIGNRWVPTAGGKISLIFKDKYQKPQMSIGTAIVGYAFYDFTNGVFKIDQHTGYNFIWSANISKSNGAPIWFGIDAGIIIGQQTNEIGFKGKAFRLNMFTEINNGIGLSIGTIRDAKKTAVPIIGIRFPF